MQEKDFDLSSLAALFRTLDSLEFDIPPPTLELFNLCEPEFLALKTQVLDATGRRETDINEYSVLLNETMKQLDDGINGLKTKAGDHAVNEMASPCHDAKKVATELEAESLRLATLSGRLVWVQNVFVESSNNSRQPTNEFAELKTISSELRLKSELWDTVCMAEDYLSAHSSTTLRDIDVGKMKALVVHMDEVSKRLQQSSFRIAALKRLEDSKNVIEGLTPVIRDLRNESMEERHWTKLEHKLQCSFTILVAVTPEEESQDGDSSVTVREVKYLDLPLRHLLEIQAVTRSSAIHQVSEEATAEAAISKSFESVLHTWEVKEIPTSAKKDREGREAYCLGDCEELLALLEESEVLLRVMDFSSYARTIQTRLTRLLSDLAHAKEVLELLQVCQQKWEYVQRLTSADFVRSFPDQAKLLQQHDGAWRSLMEGLAKKPLCVPFGVSADTRHTLQVIIEGFETVIKSLADHLEVGCHVLISDGSQNHLVLSVMYCCEQVKRQVFPAFFRLSNYELSILLSRSRDVCNIQQFLYQCFENVGRIVFGTRDAFQDILTVRVCVLIGSVGY